MTNEKIIILGHENPDIDSIVSGILLEYYLNHHTKYKSEFIIPDKEIEKDTRAICNKYHIDYQSHQKSLPTGPKIAILVDHHERVLPDTEIIAVYDHHPTNKQHYCQVYHNEIISSTAALLVKGRESYFPKELIHLAVIATFVDTASFNSTKGKKEDQIWADEMIRIFGFDKDDIQKTGLSLTDISNLQEAAFSCLKKYKIKNKNVEVSSIQIDGSKTDSETLNEIKSVVLNYFLDKNLDVYILIIHDMNLMQSTAYKIFKDGIEIDKYNQYTSRGNVIIPKLEEEIENHNFSSNKLKEKIRTINE